MTQKEWMKEGIDLKLMALLYCRHLWISIAGILVGAILSGGLYFLVHVVYAPARQYRAVSKLYLTFATGDDGDAYQYYNGYTWNDLIGTEPIMDEILEVLGEDGTFKEEARKSITADILSDIRLLTITVSTGAPEETERLVRASEEALVRFGEKMPEFEKIEVIAHGEPELVMVEDETVRAVIAGGVIGFLLTLLGMAFAAVLDDSIYVPSDFEKRYGYPVLGVRFLGDAVAGRKELEAHIARATAAFQKVAYVNVENTAVSLPEEMDETSGVILEIPYGRGNGKLTERFIAEARLCGAEILGAVITEADKSLYKAYFAVFPAKKRKKS